jgi:hypothetical protein
MQFKQRIGHCGPGPSDASLAPLFNPRRHRWERHFHWEGPYLVGRTAIGRVTIEVLKINAALRIELREELIEEGLFP